MNRFYTGPYDDEWRDNKERDDDIKAEERFERDRDERLGDFASFAPNGEDTDEWRRRRVQTDRFLTLHAQVLAANDKYYKEGKKDKSEIDAACERLFSYVYQTWTSSFKAGLVKGRRNAP